MLGKVKGKYIADKIKNKSAKQERKPENLGSKTRELQCQCPSASGVANDRSARPITDTTATFGVSRRPWKSADRLTA